MSDPSYPPSPTHDASDSSIEKSNPDQAVITNQSDVSPASATEGGREISRNVLYVGGLDLSVSEDDLRSFLGTTGSLVSVKLLHDKNKLGSNYAFVEFTNDEAADIVLRSHNGQKLNGSELKMNFAYQSSTFNTSQNVNEQFYNIFVGDLSSEVDDEALFKFFSHFPSLKQAHVMWDMQTSRSRGYGFASFRDPREAEEALQTMNGQTLLGRVIRCNWASHKHSSNSRSNSSRPKSSRQFRQQFQSYATPGGPEPSLEQDYSQSSSQLPVQNLGHPTPRLPSGASLMTPQSYDMIIRQTPSWQTTVYLGNIAHFTQQNELIPLLQNFGYILDLKFHQDKGCAFVKYDSHERAALAIVQLSGFNVNGRPLKCGWGKSRPPKTNQYPNFMKNGPSIFPGRP